MNDLSQLRLRKSLCENAINILAKSDDTEITDILPYYQQQLARIESKISMLENPPPVVITMQPASIRSEVKRG